MAPALAKWCGSTGSGSATLLKIQYYIRRIKLKNTFICQ
jgi:hypothetical protein